VDPATRGEIEGNPTPLPFWSFQMLGGTDTFNANLHPPSRLRISSLGRTNDKNNASNGHLVTQIGLLWLLSKKNLCNGAFVLATIPLLGYSTSADIYRRSCNPPEIGDESFMKVFKVVIAAVLVLAACTANAAVFGGGNPIPQGPPVNGAVFGGGNPIPQGPPGTSR
jgi:hypothetical protein